MPGVETYALYKQLTTLPVIGESVGKRIFSFAFGQVAPYFASVRPQFVTIRPNYAELTIKKRRAVKNHIGTVHAIAVCNGLEAAMGALAEASIPKDKRWIPKGMEVAYLAKSSSDLRCIAETDPSQWEGVGDLPVRVKALRDDDTVVVEGVINLWVSAKK